MMKAAVSAAYLITNVELAAPGGRAGWAEVGQNDGGQHRAPPRFHYHHAQNLSFGLGNDHLKRIQM